MPRSSESQGQCCIFVKGLDLSNNMCEYEVNQLTYEKVIKGKRIYNANC